MTQLAMRTIETIAIEINSIKEQTKNIILASSVEIGRRLVEAKSMMQHGQWGNWLADSVDYSQSTANNLMNIFEKYGSSQMTLFGDNTNSQAFANLTYSQAVALLGVPDEEREKFVEQNNVSEMTTRELQAAVKERQQAIKEKEVAEKEAAEAAKQAEKERKLREKLEKQQADHSEIVRKLQEQVDALNDADDARDDSAADALKESLSKSEKQLVASQAEIKRLQDELKAKPIDIPVKEIVEVVKVPDDIMAELESLRKKVSAGTGEEAAVFKAHFKALTDAFGNVLSSIEVVAKADEELAGKYKGAVSKLISRMSEQL
ncbi:DUF3102 domain-containing protein [Paenibacillus sp. FSL H7-0735]|uniref:DUF3102 domain-containing protein n=1 Tax=Paenibacillus sp. FSL H7-0735 TaxID=2954736 RepID=UPI0030FA4002